MSLLVQLVIAALMFPVAWIVMTPAILIGAAFDHERYISAVRNGYSSVTDWCGALIEVIA